MNRRGFTLLELLIVIAILAVLATVAVLVINPAEYLRQSRDAKRIADMTALNKTLAMAEFNNLNMGGASTTVFVSLVDTVATCANLGLPALPMGYQYRCVTTAADLRKTNGTGWVPVNLGGITGGAPLAALPTDPINDVNNFYTYIPGGSFALSATLESQKFMQQSGIKDGGTNPAKFEAGSDLALLTSAEGLVGYWPLDETTGTTAKDVSGRGNNGSGATIGWTAGCKVGGCVTVSSTNSTVQVPSSASLTLTTNVSMVNWVKINTAMPASTWPISIGSGNTHLGYGFRSNSSGTSWMFEYGNDAPTCSGTIWGSTGGINLNTNEWHFLAMTYDGVSIRTYLDGALRTTTAFNKGFCTSFPLYIANTPLAPGVFMVDEPRVYKRVLGDGEVRALYDATK